MKRVVKNKKSTGQSRKPSISANMRAVTKMQQALQNDQEKLISRLEKSIRISAKETARLSSQLDKLQKTKASGKPIRGRKPAKNAVQTLQTALKAAEAELGLLTLMHQKMIAEKKALASFEKEWKKTGAKSVKAVSITKEKKTIKTDKKSKKPAAIKASATPKRRKKKASAQVEQSYDTADQMNMPETEVA